MGGGGFGGSRALVAEVPEIGHLASGWRDGGEFHGQRHGARGRGRAGHLLGQERRVGRGLGLGDEARAAGRHLAGVAFMYQAEPVEGGGGLLAPPLLGPDDLFEFLEGGVELRELGERAGAGEAEVELLRHEDVVVDGLVAEGEGLGVLLLAQADLGQAGEAVVGVFRGAGELEDVAEELLGLLVVSLGQQAVADEGEDGRVEFLGLEVGGDLGEVRGGLLGLAGEHGELAEGEEAAGLGDERGAVLFEAEELGELLLGFGAGVGAGLGLGAGLHALDLTGELLGEEDDELLGAFLLPVVDGLGDGVGEDLQRALLLLGDGGLALDLDLGEFGLELGGELLHGLLGLVDLGAGDALLPFELVDRLAAVGELGAEILADLLGLLGELGHVTHAFGGADDLVEVGHRLRVVVVPVEDFLEQVAHALVLAAAGEELAEFAEDELEGLRIGAGALRGGLIGVDGLAGDGFLLLLELLLDRGELGAVRGLEVHAEVDVGGLDLLVELVGHADVGVADEGVDLGGLRDDLVGAVLGVVLQPVFAQLDGAGDVGRVDAELDDGLAVADVRNELTLRVFRLVLVEVDLGLLVLALEERAERVHVEDLLTDGRALVLLEEGLEGLLRGRPVDLGEKAGGDAEIDLFGDLRGEVGHVGLDPFVMVDGFGELFALLRDVAEDEGDGRDHLVLRELLDELLALRLGLGVAADPAQRDDVVVVGSGDAAELRAVLEDVEEGDVGLPGALQLQQAEPDAVGDEGVVVLVGLEFGFDLLELFEVELGAADGVGLFGVRLRGGLGHAFDLGGLGFDRLAEGTGEVHATERALVVVQRLAVEVAAEGLVGGGFGGGEARVTDLQPLEVGADHFDGGAGAAGVDLVLQLGGLLGQAQLGVHLDELVGGFAAFRRVDAFGGGLLEEADGLRVGGLLEVVGRVLGAVDHDLGRKREGVDALFRAGEGVGADLLEAGEGLVPLALLGEGFDEEELGEAAAVVSIEEIFGSFGVFIEESGEFDLGLGPVLHEEEAGGLAEGEDRLHAVGDVAGLVFQFLEEREGLLVFLFFEGLVRSLVEDVQRVFLGFRGG